MASMNRIQDLSPENQLKLLQLKEELQREENLTEQYLTKSFSEEERESFDITTSLEKQTKIILEMFKLGYEGTIGTKTMARHLSNLELLLDYVTRYGEATAIHSISVGNVDDYLGDWNITHNLSSTVQSSKDTMAALKKLCAILLEYQLMDPEQENMVSYLINDSVSVFAGFLLTGLNEWTSITTVDSFTTMPLMISSVEMWI